MTAGSFIRSLAAKRGSRLPPESTTYGADSSAHTCAELNALIYRCIPKVKGCTAMLLLCGFAATTHAGILDEIRAGSGVRCQPALKVYCKNVHVACAGRSAKPTRALMVAPTQRITRFQLHHSQPSARIEEASATQVLAHGSCDAGGQGLVLRAGSRKGYVKILANGRCAERTYRFGPALMAYGQCSTVTNRSIGRSIGRSFGK